MDDQTKGEAQQGMSDSSDDDFIAVVMDNGSMVCKGGFNGDKTCRAVVRSIVGKPLPEKTESTEEPARNIYIGEDALRERDGLTLSYPMERGCVQSWEDVEEVWKAVYHKELCTKPEEHPLLITEAPHNPSSHRERMAEVLFESLHIPGCYVVYPGVLALYASGRTTGIVIDSGDTVTSAIPIYEGEIHHHAIRRIDLGGRDITKHFQNLLHRRGMDFSSTGGFEIVRELKEKHSFMAQNFEKEFRERTPWEKKVKLQDGTAITLEEEMLLCPQVLFNPSLAGMGCKGIAELVYDTITSCGIEMRENLYQNVIMSGANFMVKGVAERLKQELTSLAPAKTDIRVVCPPERNKSAWLGGSVLASLSFFPRLVVGRADYSEVGPSVLHRCRLTSMLPHKN